MARSASSITPRINGRQVRADFNDLRAVLHYTRAAHRLGLWEAERLVVERFLPNRAAPLLEAGCGAGRATLGLWTLGYRELWAFDFAEELLAQAQSLAHERGAQAIRFFWADVTRLSTVPGLPPAAGDGFAGVLFLFNGLMQIPGRRSRRRALRQLRAVARPGAPLIFTSHDRDAKEEDRATWRREAALWAAGRQDPILREFGDRYYEDAIIGRTFMHLPDRAEILADLRATGWHPVWDEMRSAFARESRAVREFSDDCRVWVARRA
jgi:SAM-dependent methyltransferase